MNTELLAATADQLAALAQLVDGKAWGADRGKPRIYMPLSRRDAKAFFDFPDFPTGDERNPLGGNRLVVTIDDCGQAGAWYASQKKKIVERFFREALAIMASRDDGQLAAEIMQIECEIDAGTMDEVSSHLVNGRLAEARECLADFLPAQ